VAGIAPVIIEFLARGHHDVNRALRTVEQSAAASERAQTRSSQRESQTRKRSADDEARTKIRTLLQADRLQRQAQEKAVRDVQRSAQQRARAEEQAEREMVRNAERSANERIRIAAKVDREFARMATRRERENNRIVAEVARIEAREGRVRDRASAVDARSRDRFVSGVVGAAGRGFMTGVGRVAQMTTQTGMLVGQLGGGFNISDSVARNVKNAGAIGDLLNSAINPGSNITSNRVRRDRGEVEGVLDSTSTRFGLEKSSAVEGLAGITGITGDLDTALKLLPQLAELSRATGSDLAKMSDAAGNVGLAFEGMTDSGKKAERIMGIMRGFAGQGKAGNVEIKDQAVQAAKLIASAGKFEGDNAENIMKLGAIMQSARGGGGAWNAASAATAVTSFTGVFGKGARRDAFAAEGIKIDGDGGKIRAPEEIIADAIAKTGGDVTRMNKMFGSVTADRAVAKYVDVYRQGKEGLYVDASGKKLGGRAAILDTMSRMTKGVTMSKGDVKEAASQRMHEIDAQMAVQQERFDQAVREKVIPALLKLVPEFERLVPMIVDLNAKALPAFIELIKTVADFADKNKEIIQGIAEHPIGAIMAAEVTKSIASAALGETVKRLLMSALGGVGGSAGGGAGAAAGSLATPVGLGLAAGALTAGVIYNAGTKYADGEMKADDIAAKVRAWQRGDRDRGMSPEQAQAQLDAAKSRLDKTGAFEQAGNIITSPISDSSSNQYAQYKSDKALLDSAELQKALREATVAMKDNAAAVRAGGAAPGSPAPSNTGPGGLARERSFVDRP
jgi:hypothetical protein